MIYPDENNFILKERKKSKSTKTLIYIGFVLILVPIITFVSVFGNYPLSKIQSDWSDFATYINGVLTPIITLLSFLILRNIYFEIEKFSSKETHNLFFIQRRINAYEELQKYIQEFSQLSLKFHQIKNFGKSPLFHDKQKVNESIIMDIKELSNFCSNLYHYVYYFSRRYNHLFENDIKSDTYIKLIENLNLFDTNISSYYFEILSKDKTQYNSENHPFHNYELILEKLIAFSNELRNELKNIS